MAGVLWSLWPGLYSPLSLLCLGSKEHHQTRSLPGFLRRQEPAEGFHEDWCSLLGFLESNLPVEDGAKPGWPFERCREHLQADVKWLEPWQVIELLQRP